MKYYCAETLEEVQIVKCTMIDDTFDISYKNGHVSRMIEKETISKYFFKTKKQAIIAHREILLRKIKFHQEEIAKLVRKLVC